ncbi:hypothetical protein TNCV_1646841 [Trichonephila clavipes]|nr:hypothetical protein TNCV_1646841 [Trichonephila clavipes]
MDVHRRMLTVYGDSCVSKSKLMRLARMFSDGRQETRDLLRPSQALLVVTKKLILHIDTAIKENLHRNIHDVANGFIVSISSVLNWFHNQPASLFAERIHNLPKQLEACRNVMSDFL